MSEVTTALKTWAKGYRSAPVAGGKTQESAFPIQGNIEIPDKKNVDLHLYGFLVAAGIQIVTAGQTISMEIQFDSGDIVLKKSAFHLDIAVTDPIGTNTQFVGLASEFIPVQVDETINGATIDVGLQATTTNTGDLISYTSAIFGNTPAGDLPLDYLGELMNNFTSGVRSQGRISRNQAAAHATANAFSNGDDMDLPNNIVEMTGLFGLMIPNAPTASEEVVSQFNFDDNGNLEDFTPQEYPSCINWLPTLGTVVGGSASQKGRYYPIRFPGTDKGFAMSVRSKSVLALTNAPNTKQGVRYRF